jgi:hypothetical protein
MPDTNQYILFNGIELAEGSCIRNCQIENLETDPAIIESAGRIWYNITEKNFKCSTVDASDNYIIRVFSDFSELSNFINSLGSTSTGEGSNLVGYEGIVTSELTIPPTTVKNAVDILAQEIDTLKNNLVPPSVVGSIIIDEFIVQETGDIEFQLSKATSTKNSLIVVINGLQQNDIDYTLVTENEISVISISNLYVDDQIRVTNFSL